MFNNDFYCTLDLRVLDKENKKYNLFNEANNTIETSLIDDTKPLTISVWCDIDPSNIIVPKILFNNEELLRFNLSTAIRKNQIYSINVYRTQPQTETTAPVEPDENSDESSSGNYSSIVSSDIYDKICNFNHDNCELNGILKMKITQLGRHSRYTPNRDMFTLSDNNIATFEKFGLAPKPHIYHEYISNKLHYYYDKYKDCIFASIESIYSQNIFPYYNYSHHVSTLPPEATSSRKILIPTHNRRYSLICHKRPHKYIKNENIVYHFWRVKVKHGPIVSRNYIEVVVEADYTNQTIKIVKGFSLENSTVASITQNKFNEIFD